MSNKALIFTAFRIFIYAIVLSLILSLQYSKEVHGIYYEMLYNFIQANQCIVHEGYPNPCFVLGVDVGVFLYDAYLTALFPYAYTFEIASSLLYVFMSIELGVILFLSKPPRKKDLPTEV